MHWQRHENLPEFPPVSSIVAKFWFSILAVFGNIGDFGNPNCLRVPLCPLWLMGFRFPDPRSSAQIRGKLMFFRSPDHGDHPITRSPDLPSCSFVVKEPATDT